MTKLGSEPLIHPSARVIDTKIGTYTEIAEHCQVRESAVGDYSYMMEHCDIYNAQIGKFSNIASYVRLNATNHPVERATLHHFTYRAADYWPDAEHDTAFFQRRKDRVVTIGHDTWIGHGATILPGVHVGNGAVVGAGAVVTKDIEPFTIVGGIPAQTIRRRFSIAIADRLEDLAWWDWEHGFLGSALSDFRNLEIEAFLEKYEV